MGRGVVPLPGVLNPAAQPAFEITTVGAAVHLEVSMQPLPAIAGRVVDASGRPVADAAVWLLMARPGCVAASCFPVLKQTKTGASGDYSFTDMDTPGTMLPAASAPSTLRSPEPREGERLGWAHTFYPGAVDPQLATRLALWPGADLSNLDVRLAAVPVRRVRGRVVDIQCKPLPNSSVILTDGAGPGLRQNIGKDGTFEFEEVAESEWRLSAEGVTVDTRFWATQPVTVRGRDVENLELRPAPPFSIRGKVMIEAPEGTAVPPLPNVILAYAGVEQPEGTPRIPLAEPEENGDFTLRNVYRDRTV